MNPLVRVLSVEAGAGVAGGTVDTLEGTYDRFEVITVPDVEVALEHIDTDEFDCAVVEPPLEDERLSFVERVRERTPDFPVVVLVGADATDAASKAVSSGASDYVRADAAIATPELLATRISNVVESRGNERELAQYRGLVETVGDPMYVVDTAGMVTFANDAMCEMLGCNRERLRGTHSSEIIAEGDFERGVELITDVVADDDRDSDTYEVTVEPFAGDPFPAEIHLVPILDGGRSVQATVGVAREISDRKRREQRLGALHDTTRRLIEAADVEEAAEIGIEAAADVLELEVAAFYRPTEDGDRLEPVAATGGARDLFGEIPAIERSEGLVWESYETGEAIFADDVGDQEGVYNPETPIGSELLIPAGEYGVFVAASTDKAGFDATDEELARVLVSNLDRAIESVRREDRLRERERELEQYETMVRAIPDEVYTLDAEGCFTSIVPPTGSDRATSGYDPGELIDEHVSLVLDEEDVEQGGEAIVELLRSDDRERYSYEMEVVTRSGERIPIENHIALLPTDEDEEFRGTVGVLRNIAERKERERELQRQNERLEEFAHIASHDLRNPLSVADGRVALAQEECDSDHLEDVRGALDRMETLIEDTLTMAKEGQTVSCVEPVALEDLATRCWDAVPGDDASVTVANDVTVRGDPDRLARVLENLFRNAVEHGGSDVTVRCGALDGDGFFVADDGPGIPAEERSDVFEAGHTTAEDGTGFGLAIVQEIVEAHGWTIDVTESESGGTRFEITGVDVV